MLAHLVVVDAEFSPNNIIKELGICYGTYSRSFIFRPPYSISECTKQEQKQIRWLANNLHFLSWESGQYEYNDLKFIVGAIKKPSKALYFCKGAEKAQLLTSLFGYNVFDLDILGCPPASKIDCFTDECDSIYASQLHKKSLHCAQRKAIRYSNWLMNNL